MVFENKCLIKNHVKERNEKKETCLFMVDYYVKHVKEGKHVKVK